MASTVFLMLSIFLVLAASRLAEAASWRFSPSLGLSETYTDNVALQAAGQEESDFVTQVNPGFSLLADGRRLDLSLNYRLQNKFYSKTKSRNYFNHQLLASFASEPIRNLLFFDGRASYRQVLTNPQGNIGQGNIAINSSQRDVATSSLSPYVKKQFGGWVLSELRYSRDTVNYINSQIFDSISNTITGRLSDAKPSDRWSWNMAFSSRKVTYFTELRRTDNRPLPGEKWQYVDYTLDYTISRKLNFNATLGYENNEYLRSPGSTEPKGVYWNFGMVWRPTSRSTFIIGRGERYFGPAWNLNLTHSWRRSTVKANYLHDVSTRRENLLGVPLFDSNGNPILNPDTSDQLTGSVPVEGVFIRQRADFSMEYRTRKTTTSMDVFKEFRQYQVSDRDEMVDGGSLSWRWSLSRRASLTLGARLTLRDVRDNYLDKLLASSATFERKLGRQVSASIDARRTRRERSNSTGYTENLLIARLTMRW